MWIDKNNHVRDHSIVNIFHVNHRPYLRSALHPNTERDLILQIQAIHQVMGRQVWRIPWKFDHNQYLYKGVSFGKGLSYVCPSVYSLSPQFDNDRCVQPVVSKWPERTALIDIASFVATDTSTLSPSMKNNHSHGEPHLRAAQMRKCQVEILTNTPTKAKYGYSIVNYRHSRSKLFLAGITVLLL